MNGIYHILWADDEIDLLKPHIMFLQSKGYEVTSVNSGADALYAVDRSNFDLIILDENMPGLTGLETLTRIKMSMPHIPVIMITKSEEEDIMNQAVGSRIADYLIKPVNPNQILLAIKKALHSPQLVSQHTSTGYRQNFSVITDRINSAGSLDDWMDIYRSLVFWEIELASSTPDMAPLLAMQKKEANAAFAKFVRRTYHTLTDPDSRTIPMSPDLFRHYLFPMLDRREKVFFIVIDNFRLDQWQTIRPLLSEWFTFDEQMYCSILPTSTQYARNSIFSGLMPVDIARMHPDLWIIEDDDDSKNINEPQLIASLLHRYRRHETFSYHKVNDSASGERLIRDLPSLCRHQLNVIVLNFIDMLSHTRTESRMIRELTGSDAAYRSLTESWFRHSSALELLRRIADTGARIVLTTDHGTICVDDPVKVAGDRNINTNLRYKVGKNLGYDPREVLEVKQPATFGLPSPGIASAYIFATRNDFFAYPNNFNHYVQYYTGTFQHGGISLEEMLVPIVTLTSK